nr:hypothetical protein [Neobacillus sp. Marseille-Q6967]
MKVKIWYIFFLVLISTGFIYFFFNGNPAGKAESKRIVASYLEEKYSQQSFTITGISYYPGEGTYIINVASKDGEIEGKIDVKNGKIITDSLNN